MTPLHQKALKRLIPLALLWLITLSGQAQSRAIQGKVANQANGLPVSYVNIGIAHRNVGTLSNEDGSFSMEVSEQYQSDSLIFAALGFERKLLSIRALTTKGYAVVTLTEKPMVLSELIVSAKVTKIKKTVVLGNTAGGKGLLSGKGIYCGAPETAGGAVALLIQADQVPFQVINTRLKLLLNAFESFKVRVRLLAVDPKTGKPGADLFQQSVVLTSGIRQGWIEADLSGYEIQLRQERFFLVFEWIEDEARRRQAKELLDAYAKENPGKYREWKTVVDGKEEVHWGVEGFRQGTFFAIARRGQTLEKFVCYTRDSSLDEWSRTQAVLTATVTVVY